MSSSDLPGGPAPDSPAGPASDSPVGPAPDSPVGPASDSPVGPASDSPVGPASDSPAGPASDSPAGPASDSPAGPASDSPAGPAPDSPAGGLPSREPTVGQPETPPRSGRCNVLILSFLSFFLIGFGVWLASAGKRYREEYAEGLDGWRVGGTRSVELTLVRDDKRNLSCAADPVIAGLHCGYRHDLREAGSASSDDPQVLQPVNTTGNELLLGAGLWRSPELKGRLPPDRFSVICNYQVKGFVESASIRFDPTTTFFPTSKTVTVGIFTDCVLPR